MFDSFQKVIEELDSKFGKDKKKLSNGTILYGYIAEHDGWRISIEPIRDANTHDLSIQNEIPKTYQRLLNRFNGLTLYCQLCLFGLSPLTYKGSSYEEQVYGSLPIGIKEFLDSRYFIFGSSIMSEELYGLLFDHKEEVYVFDSDSHHLKHKLPDIEFLIKKSLNIVIEEYHQNKIHEFE